MTIATSSAEDSKDRSPMNNSVFAGGGIGDAAAFFARAPKPKSGLKISAKMGESLFIVEYDGSIPLRVPDNWPLPSYEVRRKLPMKECQLCHDEIFRNVQGRSMGKARRTSWIARKRGDFYWLRVCWEHMLPDVRAVIKEMYSR